MTTKEQRAVPLTDRMRTSSMRFVIEDASGYRFEVQADFDPEFGWNGFVSMASHGFKTAEDAVRHLRHAAERFVSMLKEEPRADE